MQQSNPISHGEAEFAGVAQEVFSCCGVAGIFWFMLLFYVRIFVVLQFYETCKKLDNIIFLVRA